jgi:hypothetical protein|tara:strand:+ start:244 stop:504 length:261 start_codon:yes stop_codon:yes gene_type:complete
MNPFGAYAEYGAIGVVVVLFIGQIMFLQKTLTSKLAEIEDICIKLIDRWNRSDEVRDRRHEQLLQEMNDITDDINFLKGRMNSKDA